jgi:rod shape determining protein RodA
MPVVWSLLKDYQKKRILAILDPQSDYLGSGYQTIQSLIAVGSGGLKGKGFLEGTQAHLMFLPEKHTDFIFSVIGEEFGFIGASLLVVAFMLLLLRILAYLLTPLSRSERLVVVGILFLIFFQSSVNILMTLGMFPVVGIPLPFVSFGGSAMITFGFMIGVLQSIHKEYARESFSLVSLIRRL